MKKIIATLVINFIFINLWFISQIIGPMGPMTLFIFSGPFYFFGLVPISFAVLLFSIIVGINERKKSILGSMLLINISILFFLIIVTGFYWMYTVPNRLSISILLATNILILIDLLITFIEAHKYSSK